MTASPEDRARWARERAEREAKRKAEQAAEESAERRAQGYVGPSDFPNVGWPWKDAREVRLQCHGWKGNPQVTVTLPNGTEYGLNGTAIGAGWPPIGESLTRGKLGQYKVAPPSDMVKKGIALCPEQMDDSKYKHCFSSLDGAPRGLEDAIQGSLRDPDSFEVIETRIAAPDARGRVEFITKYRARNGFGGMTLGIITGAVQTPDCTLSIGRFEG